MSLDGKMHRNSIPNKLQRPEGVQSMGQNERKCEIMSPDMPPVWMVCPWQRLLCSANLASWCPLLADVAKLKATLTHQ